MTAIYLTERELAARWRSSVRHVARLRSERRIDFVKIGRRVLYSIEAVERFEREQTVEAKCITLSTRKGVRS